MDLLDLSRWLEQQMKERNIPGDAKIQWADVGMCETNDLVLEYNPDENSVTISSL